MQNLVRAYAEECKQARVQPFPAFIEHVASCAVDVNLDGVPVSTIELFARAMNHAGSPATVPSAKLPLTRRRAAQTAAATSTRLVALCLHHTPRHHEGDAISHPDSQPLRVCPGAAVRLARSESKDITAPSQRAVLKQLVDGAHTTMRASRDCLHTFALEGLPLDTVPQSAARLMRALPTCTNLRVLSLKGCSLGEGTSCTVGRRGRALSAPSLFTALTTSTPLSGGSGGVGFPQLEVASFADCGLTDAECARGVRNLLAARHDRTSNQQWQQSLRAHSSALTPPCATVSPLAVPRDEDGVAPGSGLRHLDLSSNALSTLTLRALQSGLLDDASLLTLDLSRNQCSPQAISTFLHSGVLERCRLQSLDLSRNEGPSGTAATATITELDPRRAAPTCPATVSALFACIHTPAQQQLLYLRRTSHHLPQVSSPRDVEGCAMVTVTRTAEQAALAEKQPTVVASTESSVAGPRAHLTGARAPPRPHGCYTGENQPDQSQRAAIKSTSRNTGESTADGERVPSAATGVHETASTAATTPPQAISGVTIDITSRVAPPPADHIVSASAAADATPLPTTPIAPPAACPTCTLAVGTSPHTAAPAPPLTPTPWLGSYCIPIVPFGPAPLTSATTCSQEGMPWWHHAALAATMPRAPPRARTVEQGTQTLAEDRAALEPTIDSHSPPHVVASVAEEVTADAAGDPAELATTAPTVFDPLLASSSPSATPLDEGPAPDETAPLTVEDLLSAPPAIADGGRGVPPNATATAGRMTGPVRHLSEAEERRFLLSLVSRAEGFENELTEKLEHHYQQTNEQLLALKRDLLIRLSGLSDDQKAAVQRLQSQQEATAEAVEAAMTARHAHPEDDMMDNLVDLIQTGIQRISHQMASRDAAPADASTTTTTAAARGGLGVDGAPSSVFGFRDLDTSAQPGLPGTGTAAAATTTEKDFLKDASARLKQLGW